VGGTVIMHEGWINNEYIVLFDTAETASATQAYGLDSILIGFSIVGIRGWDEFIVRDSTGQLFSIPTVPLDAKYLAPVQVTFDESALIFDQQLSGKMKWYVTPLVFGGDPADKNNVIWVNHDQYAELVRWWNNKYLEVRRTQKS
jgi:hypothetical protein